MMNGGKKKLAAALMAAGAVAGLGGCVERTIVIGSDPPGALVMLNDVEVGHTPVTVLPFTWYGDYDVRGCDTEKNVGTRERSDHVSGTTCIRTKRQPVTPWFEIIPIDLFAELWPGQFKDEQVWAFPVPEVVEPTDAELLERAKELKGQLESTSDLKDKK